MKQKPILSANKSIRSRTLIYFMVMALSMITLLWAVQEWFFSTQYSRFKEREITKVMENAVDDFDWPAAPSYFSELQKKALENNMVVFFFSFKKSGSQDTAYENYEYNGTKYVRLKGIFENEILLSATAEVELRDSGTGDEVGWTAEQQDRFVRLMGINAIVSNPLTDNFEFKAKDQRLYYAACAATYEGLAGEQPTYFYFYAEAAISNKDVAIDIIRFEFVLLTVIVVLLSLVFSILLSSMLSSPITKISRRAEKLAKGEYGIDFGQSNIKEINNLAATLNFAAGEFAKTEQMRRDFIANISHDLRTPLTMVKAYAEMIRDISGSSPEKRSQHAQVIIDEANRLSSLVEDIQKLSKIQSGTDAFSPTTFDLDEFCAGIVRQFGILHEKFGHKLSFVSDGEALVTADRDKISQVLYNLIGNAINYARDGDKQIKVRLKRKEKSAVIEVEDNGKGIAEEDLDAVWDRYYRANQVQRTVMGSGLGLSIVKNILVRHGAVYGVKSELSKGTTFWFELPLNLDKN